MGFWDKQDKRYTQARVALIFSLTALSVSAVLVAAIVFLATRRESPPREFEMTAEHVAVPLPTPSADEVRLAKLSAWHERLSESTRDLRWSEMETLALQILEEDPSDAMAWIALARAQQQTGRSNDAMISLAKALSDQEAAPYALYLRAMLLRRNGELQAAIADLEHAANLDPGGIAVGNTLLLTKIEAGYDTEVRNLILGYVKAGIPSQEPRWLLPAAAMALKDQKPALAANFFEAFERITSTSLSAELLADPIFDPYRDEEQWKHFFVKSRENKSGTSAQPGTSPAADQ